MKAKNKMNKIYFILAILNFIFLVGMPLIYSKGNLILSIIWTALTIINAICLLIKVSNKKNSSK